MENLDSHLWKHCGVHFLGHEMAFPTIIKYDHCLLASALVFIFAASLGLGGAYEEPHLGAYEEPHLGAAGVVASEYLPQAEVEGEPDQFYPLAGIIGTTAPLLLNKALKCFTDKHIYSSCVEPHRLTESGELNVEPEYTDEYCNGPCLVETNHMLDCIDGILKSFVFLNRATLHDLRNTLESGCSDGPHRGNFDVIGHIQADDATKNKALNTVVYAVIMMVVWGRLLV